MKIGSFIVFLFTFTIFKGDSTTNVKCASSQTAYPPDPESECCGIQYSYRIIDGKYAAIDQYPWLILIEYDTAFGTKFLCGGTLISSRYVLTAAHCVTGPVLDLATPKSIRLGEYDTGKDGLDCVDVGGEMDCADPVLIIPIEDVIPHPNYDLQSRRNDIALIRLETRTPHTDFIQPICLPTTDLSASLLERISLWSAGWGVPSTDSLRSRLKQHVHIPFVDRKVCQSMYNATVHQTALWDKQLCAGGEKENDSCKGDSGGPLMLDDIKYYQLVGVASFGNYPCGTNHAPAVYTNVYKYKHWIHDTIKA